MVNNLNLKGKVVTVTGPIDPRQLGVALIHEHLLFDLSCYYERPEDEEGKSMTTQTIKLSTLGWIRQHIMSSVPNLVQEDTSIAEKEMTRFRNLGGQAVVDQTVRGLSPNPTALREVSVNTGVHIVAGTGYYIQASHPPEIDSKTVDDLFQEMITDIRVSFPKTNVQAGIIGEIGTSWPLHPNEEKCVRAAARVHRESGAALSIHPGHDPGAPFIIMEILQEENVDSSRVLMSHVDNRFRDELDLYKKLADQGCNLSFDNFGRDVYVSALKRQHPSDDSRINIICKLLDLGYGQQIFLSQDCCLRIDLTVYGGYGYGHILRDIIPRLKFNGVSEEAIKQMLVSNPQRVLPFQ